MVKRKTADGIVSIADVAAQWLPERMEQKPLSPEEAEELRETAVAEMLAAAKQMPKGSWFSYRDCKRMIAHVPFTPEQYDAVIQQLVDILQI